jgi:putative SOS response-associated peptidase YedK
VETDRTQTKQPYAIALTSGEPIAFAGLWGSWREADGDALETFTILTTAANERLVSIHDRMPVIVERKDYDRWLDAHEKAAPPADLLHPYAANPVRAWPVSDRVGNIRNNDASLLDPVDTPDEPAQGQLF